MVGNEHDNEIKNSRVLDELSKATLEEESSFKNARILFLLSNERAIDISWLPFYFV